MAFFQTASAGKDKVILSRVDILAPPLIKMKKDWITVGVIASKTETKKSAKVSRL